MSDIHDHDDDEHDHGHVPDEQALEERSQVLISEKLPLIEDVARKMGLYVEGTQLTVIPTMGGGDAALVVDFLVGDIAFSKRVQDPDTDAFDREFATIEAGIAADDFLETRERMKRNVEAGRDPLDDGDDDDETVSS